MSNGTATAQPTFLSQIAPAPSPPQSGDVFVGVRPASPIPLDLLFSEAQMQSVFGASAGPSMAVAVTPGVTPGGAYGRNFVVGGLLHFANVLKPSDGGAVIDLVRVTCAQIEQMAMVLYLFNANPTASTFFDAQAPSISAADVNKVLAGITLSPLSQLGRHTIYAAPLATQIAAGVGATDLWAVLITNDMLTTTFLTAADVMVELTVTQD